jgi:hypothetical protein
MNIVRMLRVFIEQRLSFGLQIFRLFSSKHSRSLTCDRPCKQPVGFFRVLIRQSTESNVSTVKGFSLTTLVERDGETRVPTGIILDSRGGRGIRSYWEESPEIPIRSQNQGDGRDLRNAT